MTKKTIWFLTDLDFSTTKDNIINSKKVAADGQDCKGRFTFTFINYKAFNAQVTKKGKIGIFYPEESNYNILLDQLKPYLANAEGKPAKIIKEIPYKNTKEASPAITETCPLDENEKNKAKVISILREFERSVGRRFSEADWADIMNQTSAKRMMENALEKARELRSFLEWEYCYELDDTEPP